MVDHLRWDLKQIFDMAVAEDLIRKNPAALLFTPGSARRGIRLVMTIEEVKQCVEALRAVDRAAGSRCGDAAWRIFGLTWERVGPDYADIQRRVYKGHIDRPKTTQSTREAALSEGVLSGLEQWRAVCVDGVQRRGFFLLSGAPRCQG